MHSLLMAVHDLSGHLVALADPSDYKPDQSKVPSELKDKVKVLLGFVAWVVTGLCVAGVMIVGGKMAISHRRGEGGEHAAGLAWVGGACVLVGSASAIVAAIV